ncbi:MAG: penicillin acylase family protein [Rhodospirillales bacterium]|nr:penicillin acylase family protein [Rhodospirillales bacterium]
MRSLLRTIARVLTALGILLVLLACVVGGTLWLTLPARNQEAEIEGLSAPVEISFDQDGIPRIRAANALDAAAALGFVHARDRMFQMELMRRNASGRLSELAGPATLPLDRMSRTLGLRRRAVADLAVQPPETRAMLEAYARGVNAWIEERGRFAAPEFLLLGAPDPWTPVDSLLWGKTMGLWLSENWQTEMVRGELAGDVDQALIDTLWPTRPDTIPAATASLPIRFAAAGSAWMPRFPAPFTLPGTASNEWAVDGRHTATGAPLLAGDPHLALGFPGIWYLARIETPNQVLAGATAPGVPFLVLGHNSRIAWTFTNTGADVQDVFVEAPAGPGLYQTPDGPQPFVVHEERIKVRGQDDEVLTVRETRHGPVISDLRDPKGPILAVAMGNLQPDDTAAAGLLALNRAGSVEEAGRAAPLVTAPVQNLAVADHERIGLFLTGRVPVRKAGDGSAPVPGDGSHDWIGWLSGDALPHVVAPESGRIVNGNEPVRVAGNDAFLGRDAFAPWRADRIRTLLDASNRHTAAGFARIQADVTSSFAQRVLPRLRAVPKGDGPGADGVAARAQALLDGWNGTMEIDQPQPLIFNTWVGQFYRLVLAGKGIRPDQGGPQPDFVAYVLTDGQALWCGDDCTRLLQQAREVAVRRLRESFGDDPAAWRWGTVHQAVFAHPVLRQFPILGPLTTATVAAPGDDTTIDRGETNAALQDVHGPAYRGVYDLADLDASLFVMAPGQSGNPLSRHARDFLTRWRDGATVTIGPTPKSTEATLRLIP